MRYQVWQVGWEYDVRELDVDDEECPACRWAGAPPGDLEPDPIVVAFRPMPVIESRVAEHRVIEFRYLGGGMHGMRCSEASAADIEAAKRCASEAMSGLRAHYINGAKVIGAPS